MPPEPAFIRRSPKLREALAFAASIHAEGETDPTHPLEVATLVCGTGADEDVITAALLHDVVEDANVPREEIEERFGPRVAQLVSELTEDESIESYGERKAEHRERVCRAGHDAALLFVADKLANARAMHRGTKKADPDKVGHYAATAELFRERYPDLPLVGELEVELGDIRRAVARSTA